LIQRSDRRLIAAGILLAVSTVLGAWLDWRFGWVESCFDAIAHQFYEVPMLERVRRPSQLVLVRWHLVIAGVMASLFLFVAPTRGRHARRWLAVFWLGYAVRATAWICGGNVPLVPGDSSHYLEVATSVYRGEGPVKHYVESFFLDYPRIRQNQGVLDDWATPLDAYVRAATFRILGVVPAESLDRTIAAAKLCSFVINLMTLPALYGFVRRRYGREIALPSMAVLALLPVHAIYAGFVLRESLVALTAVLAVWSLTEVWHADPKSRRIWTWALIAGVCGGLAILARNTGLALVGAAGLYSLFTKLKGRVLPLALWALTVGAVISPWAYATWSEYGVPFFSYTGYFEYNFSWTVHHYQKGNTLPSQFYTAANMPEIVRVKIKSLLIIIVTSTMILGLPMIAGFFRRLLRPEGPARDVDRLVATIAAVFIAATIKSIPDVTQVAQLGRYYLPLFAIMVPTAVAGLHDWLALVRVDRRAVPWIIATFVALVWADPTWAYDASWFTRPFQLHWPALREAGDWIKTHPEQVPSDARIMTWFPWEMRVTSDRTTVLMPRNYQRDRIIEVMKQYGITHLLWGSFEPPEHVDPQAWGAYLDRLKIGLGLTDSQEIYRSPDQPGFFFPVRLYRVR
jgi:hypothetical protein